MSGNGEEEKPDLEGKKLVDLRSRTKAYALQIIQMSSVLPVTAPAQVIGRQILRSGTSVGAHYREAARAKSDADFTSKMEGALQELDETLYWAELLADSHLAPANQLDCLIKETEELIRIMVTIVKKVKARQAVRPQPSSSR